MRCLGWLLLGLSGCYSLPSAAYPVTARSGRCPTPYVLETSDADYFLRLTGVCPPRVGGCDYASCYNGCAYGVYRRHPVGVWPVAFLDEAPLAVCWTGERAWDGCVEHELTHAYLDCMDGDPDRGHRSPLWAR